MRKTYITRLPDRAGAFLAASRIVAEEGGNIVRVNYNRAVDTHTLFLEINADPPLHARIEERLGACGYLAQPEDDRRHILMIVLTLPDEPGRIEPVLEVLQRYEVNISYISAQENGTPVQHFKMGLLIEDTGKLSALLGEISRICELKILDYEVTDRLLDGTVFYVTFANEMRRILSLNQQQTNEVLIQSNRMMQMLDEQKKSPLTTFDYIRRFAEAVKSRKGEKFVCRQTSMELPDGGTLRVFEPPCGSNTYVIERQGTDELIFVDCGFSCYAEEMKNVFRRGFQDFDHRKKTALITHADIDHTGLLDLFDRTYMAGECYENFVLQTQGRPDFREQYPPHAPYCVLSKQISEYKTPDLGKCIPVGTRRGTETFEKIGTVEAGGVRFELIEAAGGHVRGETLIIAETLGLLFTGDIFVNVRGFTEEQKAFNALAPFLMTGVDVDPPLCKAEREELLKTYGGYTLCPGHGMIVRN